MSKRSFKRCNEHYSIEHPLIIILWKMNVSKGTERTINDFIDDNYYFRSNYY